MRVVVTGSTGAVGRRACVRLAEEGHEVLGLDRRSSVAPPGVEIRTVDLAVTDLRTALASADTVVHLAAGVRAHRDDSWWPLTKRRSDTSWCVRRPPSTAPGPTIRYR